MRHNLISKQWNFQWGAIGINYIKNNTLFFISNPKYRSRTDILFGFTRCYLRKRKAYVYCLTFFKLDIKWTIL